MDDRPASGNVDAQPPFFCARAARTPATNCSLVTFTANPLSDRKNAARGIVILPSPVVSTAPCGAIALTTGERSEEHTSELQSLMRISYAVFCLKKKKKKISRHPTTLPSIKQNRKKIILNSTNES